MSLLDALLGENFGTFSETSSPSSPPSPKPARAGDVGDVGDDIWEKDQKSARPAPEPTAAERALVDNRPAPVEPAPVENPRLIPVIDEARLMIRYLREYVLPKPEPPVLRQRIEALDSLEDPERILAELREVEAEVIAAGGELPPRFGPLKANLARLVEAVSTAQVLLGPLDPKLVKVERPSWPEPCPACGESIWWNAPAGRLCLSCNPHVFQAIGEPHGEAAHG
jgi:hypothetical protein